MKRKTRHFTWCWLTSDDLMVKTANLTLTWFCIKSLLQELVKDYKFCKKMNYKFFIKGIEKK